MVQKGNIIRNIFIFGAVLIMIGSTTVTSIHVSNSVEGTLNDELVDEIETQATDYNHDSTIPTDPTDSPQTCGYKTIEITAGYSGHVRKKDSTFGSDEYNKYASENYIRVGHNKKPIGTDRHYKGFIEFDLSELRGIWDQVAYLVGAEIVFYTSDNEGDNFVSVRTIELEIYNINIRPSNTGAKKLYNDMFNNKNPYKTISASQSYQKKTISFSENTIENRMNYRDDWVAIGLNCGTNIKEGKSGGITIFSSTNKPTLIITYERKSSPTDKNHVILIEGGVGDGLQGQFHKDCLHAKSTFIGLGYDPDNIKFISYNSGTNTKNTIKNAITGWLKERSNSNSDLFIYLTDHGSDGGVFWISPGTSIKPKELDSWLDEVNYGTLTVLMDSCFSGDFTRHLRRGKNRIIITSTDSNSVAYSGVRGEALFSRPFFNALEQGKSYGGAFEAADRSVDTLSNMLKFGAIGFKVWIEQNPKIDDSDLCINYGNFLQNTLPARTLAKQTYPVPR